MPEDKIPAVPLDVYGLEMGRKPTGHKKRGGIHKSNGGLMSDNNDGPVYSMLSGKLLGAPLCAYGPSTTGSCTTGWCDHMPTSTGVGESAALAECNGIAEYFGGTCLGVVAYDEGPDGSGTITHIAYICYRVQPNYSEPGSGA